MDLQMPPAFQIQSQRKSEFIELPNSSNGMASTDSTQNKTTDSVTYDKAMYMRFLDL